ncbi:MAG TPA: tetratricopeptide repeat protein [Candidatus Polarisedimenticolaceae bacterium]
MLVWLGSTLGAVAVLASDLDEAKRNLEAERYRKALDAAERMLEASPDDPDARAIESEALLGQKRPGQAAERAEAWAGRAPGDPRPLVLLARALGAKEDWATLRRVAVRVKDAPVETRAPVFREVARQYCDGPGCEVAAELLAELAEAPGDEPAQRLDRALEAAARGARDQALSRLEHYLETSPPEPDVEFALRVVARAMLRAAERGAANPPVEGWTLEVPGHGVSLPVLVHRVEPAIPPRELLGSPGEKATLECAILRTGHVVPLRLHAVTSRAFAASSFRALVGWRYEPARKDGRPVASVFTVGTSWEKR